jgi:hypothetical protein
MSPTLDFRSLQATFVPRPEAPGQGRLFFWCMPPKKVDHVRRSLALLGILRRGKTPPTGKLELVIPTPQRNKTEDWEIAELMGIRLPLVETVRGLVRLDLDEARQHRVSDSVRVWSLAAKLAVELVARGHMVPLIDRNDKDLPYARWAISTMTAETRERIAMLEQALPIAAHSLVLHDGQDHEAARKRRRNRRRRRRKPVTPETTVWRADALLRAFLDSVADAIARDSLPSTSKDRPRKDNRDLAPWELRWRYSLTAGDPQFEHAGLVEQPLVDQVLRWAAPVRPRSQAGTAYTVAFQLEQPGQSAETDKRLNAWYLRYLLQANDDASLVVDAKLVWAARGGRVEIGGRVFAHAHESLLEALAETSRVFGPVARSLHVERPIGVMMTTEEAWEFISTIGPMLHQFGMTVRVPANLRADGHQRLRLRLHVGGGADWDDIANRGPSKVGLQSLSTFRWQVALGEHDLTPEEFREIAAMREPLVQWRGQWMAVDPDQMSRMQSLFEGAESTGRMDQATALTAALTGTMTTDGGDIEVVAEGEIARLISALRAREDLQPITVPKSFKGELRPYQERGLTWLSTLTSLGFGVCLADDMGLGKTIQVLALLLAHQERDDWKDRPALLVCPTSVLGNWERELKRFAPSLNVLRHHGRNRASSAAQMRDQQKPFQVVLTTYVIARMDQEMLAKRDWSFMIIDEAQNIKNPVSQQAVAIRHIPAQRRIAMTGTPVENRLAELWSILEFANPGLLGKLPDFRRRFSVPIERFNDNGARETLRRLVTPFILRRVKTDPTVIQDLPEKQEYKVFCNLTREQAALYQAAVDNALQVIEQSTGVQRRGNILALLTRLKQICNHPVQYLKDEGKLPTRSGKLTRLTEMMDEVAAEGQHALIFPQFKEMGDLLVKHLRDELGFEPLFIHGGVSAENRDRIVEAFQNDADVAPALVLSIKAGGTGLNLTRATHVFHFDRWWNPAVEDQATDRAYRVGQTRDVLVHKLVVSGTIEEKIDEILESKRSLAESVVGTGESWITELSDRELRDLFTLGNAASIDDDEAEGSP